MFLEEPLMSTQQLAKHLGMSEHWVWSARKYQGLPAIKMGARNYKYKPSAVMGWLDEHTTTNKSPQESSPSPKRQKGKVNLFE